MAYASFINEAPGLGVVTDSTLSGLDHDFLWSRAGLGLIFCSKIKQAASLQTDMTKTDIVNKLLL